MNSEDVCSTRIPIVIHFFLNRQNVYTEMTYMGCAFAMKLGMVTAMSSVSTAISILTPKPVHVTKVGVVKAAICVQMDGRAKNVANAP